MHWLQNAFCSSKSHPHSDEICFNRQSHVPSFFSFRWKGRAADLAFRSHQRRLTRARKLRHLTDDDLSVHYSSPRSSSASPHPLPLPEDRKAASASISVPLPSPNKPGEESKSKSKSKSESESDRQRNHAFNADAIPSNPGFGSRLGCQEGRRSTEHAETQSSRNSNREPNGVETSLNNRRPNILINAPVSTFSSPALSPQRNRGDIFTSPFMPTYALQAWSAPEIPPSDMTTCGGFPNQMSSGKAAFSGNNSPLHSPRLSPHHHQSARSPSGPPSPLNSRLSVDSSVARRETNAQANVHPLPLPPGASTPSLPASPPPAPQATAKREMVPMKSQWQKGKLIGRGTFGSVYVASNRETGALCAMKEVELLPDDPQSTECIRQLEQEIKVLSQLQHPNIVQYYGSEIVGDRFYIYLEYVHPGSINKYIHDHCGSITESIVRNFTRHILSGLAYLHSTKTIHRDIKGPNLLVDAYGVVKLADFGMAKHLTGQAANLSLKGSPYWMAPELLQSAMQQDSSPDLALAVDIWSLGCTIIEMLNGKPPWGELEGAAAMFKVLKGSPPIPETLSPEGKDFLRCCFRRNPAERPSASLLLEHSFLKSSQKEDVSSCTQSINRMKLTDKRERPSYKLDTLSVPVMEAQITKRKLANP